MKIQPLKRKNNFKKGQVVITLTIFFLIVTGTVVLGLAAPTLRQARITSDFLKSRNSYFLAEAGMEDVLYRLKNNLPTQASQSLTIENNTVTTNIADTFSGKIITAEGNWQDHIRKVETRIIAGVGVSFNYGVQAGNGGFEMDSNASVTGNVYSNGNISGENGSYITGSAIAANSVALATDQSNSSPSTPPNSINFRNVSTSQDLAQSFQVGTTSPINKIQLYIKKTGNPANISNIHITNNNSGNPGSAIASTGSINSSLITTNYGWLNAVFTSNPTLYPGTTYWIVADNGSQNASNYYTVGANSSYATGTAKVGSFGGTWNNTSPVGLDAYFTVSVGGLNSTIDNVAVGTGSIGDAKAHTVRNSTIAGSLYCQVGSGNNKPCNTSQPDPTPIAFPVSDANIEQWKTEAQAGTVILGNYTPTGSFSSLGPTKIIGNLNVPLGHTLTITGTVYVTGTITINNNVIVQLNPSFGTNSGAIISDNRISLGNNIQFNGSGQSSSFVLLLTTSDCPDSSGCSGNSAVSVSNNAGTIIINAQRGTVSVDNNAGAKEITANKIHLKNNANIIYDSGLINVNFSSGPGGAWNITSWKEVQ